MFMEYDLGVLQFDRGTSVIKSGAEFANVMTPKTGGMARDRLFCLLHEIPVFQTFGKKIQDFGKMLNDFVSYFEKK